MAASSDTRSRDDAMPPGLRVRLEGPDEHHAAAAWALEALLARARVLDWRLVGAGEDADLVWGGAGEPTVADLPAAPGAWHFTADSPPDVAGDPLACTFWWLARVEEQIAPPASFDEHGRFRADASAIVAGGDPFATPVDDLAAQLADRLARWRTPLPAAQPRYRIVATHDIDLPVRWTRSGRRRALRHARDSARRGRLAEAARTCIQLAAGGIARRDPWDNFDRICELEAASGAASTSYLLVGREAPEDGDAELHERGAGWAGDVAGHGRERLVGLHGSYTVSDEGGASLDVERIALEQRLGSRIVDHRFHYLRHRPVRDWPRLEAAGLRSDASLGFAEQPGFRAGTAHPFRAWDHERGMPLDLVVIPLAVMDASFDERYLALGRRERLDAVRAVLRRVLEVGGSASLLVHNDRLCNAADDGWTAHYRTILEAVREHGGSACTARDAAEAYLALLPASRTRA